MKTTFLFAAMLLTSVALQAQYKLTVQIDGIETTKGQLFLAIYNEEDFLKKPLYGNIVKVDNNEVVVVLDNVAPGEYAASIYHDENNNNKLDSGSFGIPIEKTGFSNNARGAMGPPAFKDCAFKVEENAIIYITLESYN